MKKDYYVYMMTNESNNVVYTGVTSNLAKRVYEHKNKLVEGFTKKYKITKLVWYEQTGDPSSAILREKQIKGGSRRKKVILIDAMNPQWLDLQIN
jgi:putative endonuclease